MSNMIITGNSPIRVGTMQTVAQPTGAPKDLQDVIAQLTEELTKGGKLDESSPLGKLVAEHLQFEGVLGSGPEQVQKGVENLIKDKLGEDFGALKPLGGGGRSDGVGGGGGQQDLMSQVLNGLVKSMLGDVLQLKGEKSTFPDSAKPLLSHVADFMDANPKVFPKPDSGSWQNELGAGKKKTDNMLDADETKLVRAALNLLSEELDGRCAVKEDVPPQHSNSFGSSNGGGGGKAVDNYGETIGSSSAVDELREFLENLLDKLEGGEKNGDGSGMKALNTRHHQSLPNSLSQTASALVQELLGGGTSKTEKS